MSQKASVLIFDQSKQLSCWDVGEASKAFAGVADDSSHDGGFSIHWFAGVDSLLSSLDSLGLIGGLLKDLDTKAGLRKNIR